jgi:uncharacterized protein (TIGR02118 family)
MIKAFHLLSKSNGTSAEEFNKRWEEEIAPAVAETPGLRGYKRLPESTVPSPAPVESPFDGIDELWFDDLESFHAGREAIEKSLAEKANGLLDGDVTRWLAAEEHVIVDGPSSGIKISFMLHHLPNQTLEECHQHWLTKHVPTVVGTPGLKRYVQSHVLVGEGADEPDGYDGVAEAWFDDVAGFEEFLGSEKFQVEQSQDMPNFVDATRLKGFFSGGEQKVV